MSNNTPVLSFSVKNANDSESSIFYTSFARDTLTELSVVIATAGKMNWTSVVFVGDTEEGEAF